MHSLTDYDFPFSEDKIALRPITPRGAAKLLYFDGQILDRHVRDYLSLLTSNDLLVFNDTKVLEARLEGYRERQSPEGLVRAKISVTLLKPLDNNGKWQAMIKPLKKINVGEYINFSDNFRAELISIDDGFVVLKFDPEGFEGNLSKFGHMPLPPYIAGKRKADEQDFEDYQPKLAKHKGAVASPTASLHFDDAFFEALKHNKIGFETLTLHVGAGTFLPVKVDNLDAHKMHSEHGILSKETAARINQHKKNGGRVIAVGTTVLRLLESATLDGELVPFDTETEIFIRPGFDFQICDGLITNFHLPKSTLLMLVAAFIGFDNMKKIYDHALNKNYRFFSYGDSSFLIRNS